MGYRTPPLQTLTGISEGVVCNPGMEGNLAVKRTTVAVEARKISLDRKGRGHRNGIVELPLRFGGREREIESEGKAPCEMQLDFRP